MIIEVVVGNVYKSRSGIHFKVLHLARHGQDCNISMVVYTNLFDTFDSKSGTVWVLSESMFLKMFDDI